MKFHLNHTPQKQGFEMTHADRFVLTGSCFSENIGALLRDHKFKTESNPSGILFNPLSIYNCLNSILTLQPFEDKYILQRGNSFFSYRHHSSVNRPTKEELIASINSEIKTAHHFLKEASYLIITFGSSFYYQHLQLNEAVANCHKQPAATFEKRLLALPEITELYSKLIQQLQKFNPTLRLIFTVSPVKHLKDGVVENSLSKAILISAVHQLTKAHHNCFYFPAYELVTDDLRDYRFYKEDLAHPNEQAIAYVWEKFSDCYFDDKTKELTAKIAKLNSALNHRHLHTSSEESEKLRQFINRQKEDIQRSAPGITF